MSAIPDILHKDQNFLVESLLRFTIDAVGNVEVYHKIIIFR